MSLTLWLVIIIIALIIGWLIAIFNNLVTLKNRVKEAWSDIEVQLKRRYDLIPNLVESVKGYAKHEKGVFENVTKARAEALSAKAPAQRAAAENMITEALKTIFAVAEDYPELRASENFKALQDELSDTENKIQAARRFYNANVRDFNTKIEIFPNNLIANSLGFKQYELFEAGEAEEKTVKVNF